jgi:hypothetical protein
VLALPDVVHFFTHELAGLRGGGLALFLGFSGALGRSLLGHDLLLVRLDALDFCDLGAVEQGRRQPTVERKSLGPKLLRCPFASHYVPS